MGVSPSDAVRLKLQLHSTVRLSSVIVLQVFETLHLQTSCSPEWIGRRFLRGLSAQRFTSYTRDQSSHDAKGEA